jgi:hypothetical protein
LTPPALTDTSYKRIFSGGGQVYSPLKGATKHKCRLDCNPAAPQSLEITYGNNKKFVLQSFSAATCSVSPTAALLNPALNLGLPRDVASVTYPFNTYTATGSGTLNGASGYKVTLELTDDGEAGINDHFSCRIVDSLNNEVCNVSGFLRYGNHQAQLYK